MNKIEKILSGLPEGAEYEINTELEIEDDHYYYVATVTDENGYVDSAVYYDPYQMDEHIALCKQKFLINQ